LIITQFIGVPFSFLFGALAKRVGAKNSILMALGVYFLISVGGYMMKTPRDFYALAMVVGMVQGGSQALSRSVYGAMVPKHKSAEFFGFFSTTSKFAGIAGPLLFGIVSQLTGESRMSIACMVFFFVIGGFLLTRVDVEEGKRAARAAEKEGARL
jgi:UMF1 family MFS transporter